MTPPKNYGPSLPGGYLPHFLVLDKKLNLKFSGEFCMPKTCVSEKRVQSYLLIPGAGLKTEKRGPSSERGKIFVFRRIVEED